MADKMEVTPYLYSWPLSQNIKVKGHGNGNSWISRERLEVEASFQCNTYQVEDNRLNESNPIFVLVTLDLESDRSKVTLMEIREYLENG